MDDIRFPSKCKEISYLQVFLFAEIPIIKLLNTFFLNNANDATLLYCIRSCIVQDPKMFFVQEKIVKKKKKNHAFYFQLLNNKSYQ